MFDFLANPFVTVAVVFSVFLPTVWQFLPEHAIRQILALIGG